MDARRTAEHVIDRMLNIIDRTRSNLKVVLEHLTCWGSDIILSRIERDLRSAIKIGPCILEGAT